MPDLFPPDFFANNRASLRKALPDEPLIAVTANGLLQRGSDNSFPFYQDSNFWYLTGIDEPDIILVMAPVGDFLIVPNRSVTRQAFDGVLDKAMLGARAGITEVVDETAGWERLIKYLRKGRRLATPFPPESYIEPHGLYANPARKRFVQRCRQVVPNLALKDVRQDIGRLRMIKQAPELKAIKQAIKITNETLNEIIAKVNDYEAEYQIEADLSHGFRNRGSRFHAFEPIIAGGAKACTLHNVTNDAQLKPGELILMDVGAEYSHYASDITRTIAYGEPSKRQKEVYAAVLDVQKRARSLLKPGIDLRSYEVKVEKLIGQKLRDLGVIDSQESAIIRHYYPHSVSHFMGLDVHDVGDYEQPLAEGVVMTVEPGIYIPEEGIGVRIEDDVLITKDGAKLLSTGLPRVLK